ncbi:site-specific DNA recombinase [Anoxybacillus voinovskiensis]|uniref:Site-specific DNA recombinase n=1 Tax=Anoxybacteroides voinovskiense TaxID=230470 RepID=A0A840E049_9BACL|nr:recombinase family protein [Anoxybacillus voinovskiensis]MBB4075119.1 site-specific DNA recombinase [Anoxybacillus voinovskiensis]GGJ76220.1 integrase [Anoxybacillus voinovskiensis]
MKVAIYVRVSTDEQAKEGFSIPAQRERLRAFCASQGWEIVQEYIEEGWSAKDLERPQMRQLLKDIKKGNIDIILVYRLDRLTRSVLDLYLLLQTFEKYNVAFRSATEVYDTSTAMGRLFITLVAALAQWERENLAERVKFGIEQMIDEGKKPGGHSPYGYKFDKDFNCTVVEEEAKTVQMIYRLYCDGYGYRSIADRLNELGIKPRIAKEWNHISIRDILTNDIYIGTYRWGNKVVPNNHPAIISEPLFKKVQKEREKREVDRSRVGKFLFTGLLYCGNCNEHKMQGSFDKREQKTYYRCLKCNRITHEKNILESLLAEVQLLITSKEYFMSKFSHQFDEPKTIDVSALTKELEKIKRQKEKWYDLYMDDNNPIPKEELFAKINELNEKEKEIYETLSECELEEKESIEEKYNRISKMTDFKQQFEQADDFTKKELLFSIFERIVMYREKGKGKKLTLDYTLK